MPAGRPKGTFKLLADEATLDTVKALANIQCILDEAAGVLKVCEKSFVDFFKSIKSGTRGVGKWLRGGQGRASCAGVTSIIFGCVASRPSLLIAARRNPTNKRQ